MYVIRIILKIVCHFFHTHTPLFHWMCPCTCICILLTILLTRFLGKCIHCNVFLIYPSTIYLENNIPNCYFCNGCYANIHIFVNIVANFFTSIVDFFKTY